MTTTPKHPDVHVQLTGHDGNIFNLVGIVARALNRAGFAQDAKAMSDEVFAAEDYNAALSVLMNYVEVS